MKKFIVIIFLFCFLFSSAQKMHNSIHYAFYSHPRLYFGVGYNYYYWLPVYHYDEFPPYYYGHEPIPHALKIQIEAIRENYKYWIKDTKHDKSITQAEKDYYIEQLMEECNKEVIQACHDFYNQYKVTLKVH